MIILSLFAGGVLLVLRGVELGKAHRRLAAWPVAPTSDDLPVPDVEFIEAPGVRADAAVKRAVAAYLDTRQLDAVDVVPCDLGSSAALDLLAAADPSALATDPFTRTAGAGYLIAARKALIERAALAPPTDAAAVAAAAEQLRRFAVLRTATVIAPGFRAVNRSSRERPARLRAQTGIGLGPKLYVEGVCWALLATALIADVRVGLVVVALLSIGGALVFAGGPIAPRDRWWSIVARVPSDFVAWLRACIAPIPNRKAVDALRPTYAALLADGTAPFFSVRRTHCPICGDTRLATHIVNDDLVQRKPGRFTLERCDACGVVFQNPPLSQRGLSFYYRDFYDGLGEDTMDELFASTHPLYTSRVESVLSTGATPARWLDLGCGYAHFSLAAKRRLPNARFEGMDQSPSVDVGVQRGWIDRAWRAAADEVADAGERFDVVSLFHFLEHTQDPGAELKAAARLLAPNGLLILEIPNPECRLGRWLGRFWFPWFQPQHQILLNTAAVRRLLDAANLQPVSVTYLQTAGDVLLSTMLAVRRLCSPGDVPWAPVPSVVRRLLDLALWAAAFPFFVGALVIDAVYARRAPSPTTSNALRVIAAPATQVAR